MSNSNENSRKQCCIGLLAHVDAGKTTTIEAMLYTSGTIQKMGRIDNGDAVLDYDEQERSHGITIYAKEAFFSWKDTDFYVIDTPGHVDFSSEMERSLRVLDLAVIVINGQNGVQSHTETIWKCLEHYNIPTMIFVNKMDISYLEKETLLKDLKKTCSSDCIDFSERDEEELSLISEAALDEYLESGRVSDETISEALRNRKCFPVIFGSALKLQNIGELMDTMAKLTSKKEYPAEFGARVFRISSDEQGNRLTHIKMTGGTLKAKEKISEDEKADQIRRYNGTSYELLKEASAGMICVLKGPEKTEAGSGLGFEEDMAKPLLDPFLHYQLLVPNRNDSLIVARIVRQLAEEDPQLLVNINEDTGRIELSIMGEMQKEVLQKRIADRCGISVGFSEGGIVYRETILHNSDGAGHFEPLRHYAEVHVRLEPLPPGSGIIVENEVPKDSLSPSWQRTILSILEKKKFCGVLSGSQITDIRIVLTAARGHLKHTEGGDFRQAASRAVRQALKKAECQLLEPYYAFTMRVPKDSLSRALFELEQKEASFEISEQNDTDCVITGNGPVRTLMNYQADVSAYTKGKGLFTASPSGYQPVKEQDAILDEIGYDSESDLYNPTGSVFCANGAGYFVPWDKADEYMHIQLKKEQETTYTREKIHVSEDELESILHNASGKNRNDSKVPKCKAKEDEKPVQKKPIVHLPGCMIIDGYNMIFGWKSFEMYRDDPISVSRERLIDILAGYQAYTKEKMIIVFDGYRVAENIGTVIRQKDLEIVYTKTNETADEYIQKIASDLKKEYQLSVVSSDGLIQNAIFAQGALRVSARELEERIRLMNQEIENM